VTVFNIEILKFFEKPPFWGPIMTGQFCGQNCFNMGGNAENGGLEKAGPKFAGPLFRKKQGPENARPEYGRPF